MPLTAEVVRELEPSDLLALGEEKGSKPPSLIKRLSERHHGLARNLALGMDHQQAAAVARYSESRISILLSDPAFKELIAFYRKPYDDATANLGQVMGANAMDAAYELADRLEETPESFSIGQLMEVTKLGADRTGFGPQATNVNVNVDFASRLQEARKRVEARQAKDIIL